MQIFVEGGGDDQNTRRRCRVAFVKFFEKVVDKGKQPKVRACGGRDEAFKAFRAAIPKEPEALLLVDAEGAVPSAALSDPWPHLGWKRPDDAGPRNVALMVQEMESWLLADKTSVATYYGNGFREKALPAREDIESVPKAAVNAGLAAATKDTKKGPYDKALHGFDLIERIDPKLVRAASPHAERLCRIVRGEPDA